MTTFRDPASAFFFRVRWLVLCLPLLLTSQLAQAQVLEEIVVTAQKREQSLQDVPISVSAYDGRKLQDQNFLGFDQFSEFVPGLKISQTLLGTRAVIRGQGTSGANVTFENSVATFVDGIYTGRRQQLNAQFLDLERIEVLKGPQPTYFGQNAIAGAINVITRGPTDVLDGFINVSASSENEQWAEFAIGGPVSESFGLRLAGKWDDREGWIASGTGEPGHPLITASTVRLTGEWSPTDRFDLTFRVGVDDYQRTGTNTENGTCDDTGDGVGDPMHPAEALLPCVVVQRLGFDYDTERDWYSSSNAASTVAANAAGPFISFFAMGVPAGDFTAVEEFTDDTSYQDGSHASAEINYQFENGITLTSLTGANEHFRDGTANVDRTRIALFQPTILEDYEQFSQELRLTSQSGQTLEWMAGAYLQDSDLQYQSFEFAAIPVGMGGPPGATGLLMDESSRWTSAFATVTFNATDRWAIDLGVRYTEVEKSAVNRARFSQYVADPNGPTFMLGPLTVPTRFVDVEPPRVLQDCSGSTFIPGLCVSDSLSQDNVDATLSTTFDVNDDTMLYAKYATGFKAGGFNVGMSIARTFDVWIFDPEEVQAIELGLKTTLADGRMDLNLALFDSSYEDLQVSIHEGTEVGVFNVRNAAEASSSGFEFDGRFAVAEGFLLTFGGTFLDAGYDSFPGASCNQVMEREGIKGCRDPGVLGPTDPGQPAFDAAGEVLPAAADWEWSAGFALGRNMGDSMRWSLIGDALFSGEFQSGTNFDPRAVQGSYTLVNLRWGVGPQDERWEVSVYGNNLTDEYVLATAGPAIFNGAYEWNPTPKKGRSLGAALRYNFGN